MYLEHFGFKVEPFEIAPNAEFLYLSKAHKKAFTYLNYALWNKDTFTLLTGEIGSGKTILLQHLLKTMPSTALIVTIYQTQLSPQELLQSIAQQLRLVGDDDQPSKPKLHRILNEYIHALDKNLVIVVDEAQSFPLDTLEELRLLAGADIVSKSVNNVNVILSGQPELRNIVEGGGLQQLNQRIKLRFHLTTLDYQETVEYLAFRTAKAGQKLEIFTADAIKKVFEYTHGLPRLINILADTALTCGFADGFYAVSSKQVEDAVGELNWDAVAHPEKRPRNENVVRFGGRQPAFDLSSAESSELFLKMEVHLDRIATALESLIRSEDMDDLSQNGKKK